jgi:hypothetical protein
LRLQKKKLKTLLIFSFHLIGLSSIGGGSLVMCWVFFMLAGWEHSLLLYENIAWIRYCESILMAFGAIYVFYLLSLFIKKATKK